MTFFLLLNTKDDVLKNIFHAFKVLTFKNVKIPHSTEMSIITKFYL